MFEAGVPKKVIIEYVRMKYNAEMIIHQGVLVSRVEEKERCGLQSVAELV